jgi:hypothetical protein
MSRLFFRFRQIHSPGLANARKNKDIPVDSHENALVGLSCFLFSTPIIAANSLLIDGGGVSVFSFRPSDWLPTSTWALPDPASLNPGLVVTNDVGGHWIISPRVKMPFDTYIEHLRELDSKSVRLDQLELPADDSGDAHTTTMDLANAVPHVTRGHSSRAVRFVSDALAQVYHDRTPIAGWDENDRAYIGVIAEALSKGNLPIEDVYWSPGKVHPELGDQHTTKLARFVAMAVGSHMKTRRDDPAVESDSEEDMYMRNDNIYFQNVLRFVLARNPLAVYDPYFKQDTVEEA